MAEKRKAGRCTIDSTQGRGTDVIVIGAGLALLASALLGVLLCTAITQVLPLRYIRLGAGGFFVIIGLVLLLGRG